MRTQVVEDERVTTTSPTRDADAGMRGDGGGGGGVITSILTISEAKEKLKARRIKNRKKMTVLKEEQQQPQQYKRTDEIHSPGSSQSPLTFFSILPFSRKFFRLVSFSIK